LQSQPLSKFSLISYSLPSAPTSMLMMMLVVYLAPFYASEMGLPLATIGGIFFFARLFDAISDPVVGNLSDLTRSRFGRRKPWIALGTPVLMIALYFFFQPPEGISVTYLAISAVLFYVAITMVQIPYLSWGAELSRDYVERIRINSYREAGTMIGVLLVAAIPLFFLRGTDPSVSDIVGVFTIVVLVLFPATVIPALFFAPQGDFIETPKLTLFKALYTLRVNKPFQRLILASLFIWVGGHIYNASSFFLIKDALGFSPSMFLWFMVVQFGIGLMMMPIVLKVGKKIGKHRALLFIGLSFFPVLWLFFLVEPQNVAQAMAVYALKGAVTAAIWVMPPALVADSIEHGMLEGAGDDAALYMSLYFFIQKLAAAIGVGLALPLAAALGFDPQSIDSTTTFEGIKFVSIILPSIVVFPAIFLLYNYPIDEARHMEIRKELESRGIVTT